MIVSVREQNVSNAAIAHIDDYKYYQILFLDVFMMCCCLMLSVKVR